MILTWLNENTAPMVSTYATFVYFVILRKLVKLSISSDT